MIRMIFCVRRRADVELLQFRRSWVEPMRDAAAELARAAGANRHELSVLLDLPENAAFVDERGYGAPYDAVLELEYASGAAVRAHAGDPKLAAARAKVHQLNSTYVDLAASSVFFAEDLAAED